MEVGDFVGFVFGMPGPDITYAIVREVTDDGQAKCYDPTFDVTFTAKLEHIWLATDRELDMRIGLPNGQSATWRTLLKKASLE